MYLSFKYLNNPIPKRTDNNKDAEAGKSEVIISSNKKSSKKSHLPY